jgi:hypothetical protein
MAARALPHPFRRFITAILTEKSLLYFTHALKLTDEPCCKRNRMKQTIMQLFATVIIKNKCKKNWLKNEAGRLPDWKVV